MNGKRGRPPKVKTEMLDETKPYGTYFEGVNMFFSQGGFLYNCVTKEKLNVSNSNNTN